MIKRKLESTVQIDGWSIQLSTIVQLGMLVSFVVTVAGAWWDLRVNQDVLGKRQQELSAQISEVTALAERNRQERVGELKELRVELKEVGSQISALTVDGVRLDQQIINLNLLLGDIRKLIDSKVELKKMGDIHEP